MRKVWSCPAVPASFPPAWDISVLMWSRCYRGHSGCYGILGHHCTLGLGRSRSRVGVGGGESYLCKRHIAPVPPCWNQGGMRRPGHHWDTVWPGVRVVAAAVVGEVWVEAGAVVRIWVEAGAVVGAWPCPPAPEAGRDPSNSGGRLEESPLWSPALLPTEGEVVRGAGKEEHCPVPSKSSFFPKTIQHSGQHRHILHCGMDKTMRNEWVINLSRRLVFKKR